MTVATTLHRVNYLFFSLQRILILAICIIWAQKLGILKQKCLKLKPRESLSELELNVAKLIELKPGDAISIELRDHLLDLY